MSLQEYTHKRDFKKTPEPPPGRRTAKEGRSYLIQKHDATRLHYDLRLELDGVLLSWAVTKGPSLDPADKRLAVRTEDHPLSYGSFEGTVPKGQYGGGTVMLWDQGSWEPKGDPRAGLKKGHLSFVLHGGRLKGGWDLIRMHGDEKHENWLLIKEKDAEARAGAANFLEDNASSITTGRSMDEIAVDAPSPRKAGKKSGKMAALLKQYPDVQLATLVDAPPPGGEWLHEIKFDGYRLLAFLDDGAVVLRTRNGNDWTEKFPAIYAAVAKIKAKSAVLDLEAVVLDPAGKSSFQALQHALGGGGGPTSIIGCVFDLLYLDGKDLTGLPLTERKKKLGSLLKKPGGGLRFSEHIAGQGGDMIAKSCAMGLEGIISKQANAPYRAGRQKSWLKTKCVQRQEFIIIGYNAARKGDRAIGALHLGYQQDGQLKYAGKAGTGFTMSDAREIFSRLAPLETKTKPSISDFPRAELKFIHWVRPVLLCEVAFTEWTADGHIRHPSFQGLREDKPASDIRKEVPLPVEKAAKKPADKKPRGSLELSGIAVTHPDRVISDAGHITKGQLAEYYAAVAPYILRDIAGHPLSLLRCPAGLDEACFFQRSPGQGLGPDILPFHFRHKGKDYEYLYIEDEKGLMELIQMGAIELHPWGARAESIDYPDRLIFDLDPDPSVSFEAVKLAAMDLRARLADRGLESYVRCTGGKGLHVTMPLAGKDTWAAVKAWCAGVADEMVRDVPEAYVATMSKAKRRGKIFIDYFRNDYTATAIADFSTRARPGAPVAVPLEWKELDRLKAGNQFKIDDVLERLKKKQPDSGRYENKQRLPKTGT
jgi:bifunctional non-homologous end joining protein LigD